VSTGDDRKQFVINPYVDAFTVGIGIPDWYSMGQLTFINGSERMRIDNNGNVGIGTPTPQVKLDVVGYVRTNGNDDVGGCFSIFNSSKTGAIVNNWAIFNMTGVYGNALKFWRYYQDGTNAGSALTLYDNGDAYLVGNVGIGQAFPGYKLDVAGTTRTNGLVIPTGATSGYVLTSDVSGAATWQAPNAHTHIGQTWSSSSSLLGLRINLNANSSSAYVYGISDSVTNAGSWSVYGGNFFAGGSGTGYKYGVYGTANAPASSGNVSYGVVGYCYHAGSGAAFGGDFYGGGSGTGSKYGVYSSTYSPAGSTSAAYGIYTTTTHYGSGESYGGHFAVTNDGTGTRRAVYGITWAPSGSSNPALSINGDCNHAGTGPAYGGYFAATGAGSGTKCGVYAEASGSGTLWAGYFSGNVEITGSHGFGNGFFLIDHPLDPQNKTLRQNLVESPENLYLYRGKVKLNSSGEGKVAMPSYFKALTKETEATVTLTSIGRPFNSGYEWNGDCTVFTAYGEPNREVSYIVMADRDDPVIRQLSKPVEQEKGNGNFTKGKLLYPKAYGYPEEMGEDYERQQELKAAHADDGK
jgi:hypothetical protein